jgi:predicted DNA-binding transcriptional regulator AlpA
VGYVAVNVVDGIGVVILLIANTASAETITVGNDTINGWAAIVVGTWAWAPMARRLRFPRDDRMARDDHVFSTILRSVKARPGSHVFWGREKLDPHADGWRLLVGARKSSDENEARKARTTAGALRKARDGAWNSGTPPVGYRFGCSANVRGELVADLDLPLEPDASHRAELEAVLTDYSHGLAKSATGVAAARRGARDGNGKLIAPAAVPLVPRKDRKDFRSALSQLHESGEITAVELQRIDVELERTASTAMRRVATTCTNNYVDRIVQADSLRTGVLVQLRCAPTKGCPEYLGWYPTFVVLDRDDLPEESEGGQYVPEGDLAPEHPYWKCTSRKRKKLRDHGFWLFHNNLGSPVELDAGTWTRIQDRRRRDQDEFYRRVAGDGNARPLVGAISRDENGRSFKIRSGGDAATFVVDVLDASQGAVRREDWVHLHTLRATNVLHALGELLLGLDERAGESPIPVVRAPVEPETAEELEEGEMQSLVRELALLDERLKGYARELAGMSEGTASYRATIAVRDEDAARWDDLESRLIPEAQARVHAVPKLVDDTPKEETEAPAGFAQVAAVGLGLLRCNPYGPAPLARALSWLIEDGEGLSNLRTGTHPRQVLIDVRVRVPLADGTIEWVDAGTLDLTDHSLDTNRIDELVSDAARRLLRDGEPATDLAKRYDWSVPDLLRHVAGWLSETVRNSYLRAAAVTAAASEADVPVGKVLHAVASHSGDEIAALEMRYGRWIIGNIQRAYLAPESSWSHATGWIRRPLGPWRAAMLGVARSGAVRRHSLVALVPGISNDEMLKDALHPGRTSHWQPPLQLHDGWVSPFICDRKQCPGGGAAPMTGFLPVPELIIANSVVFCEYCGVPSGGGEPVPAAYRQLWDVASTTSSLSRADGIPTMAEPPDAPVLACSLRTRDVANRVGLPDHTITRMASDREIPATLSATGKWVYNERDLERPSVIAAFAKARAALRPGDAAADTIQVVDEATSLLGATPKFLRHLVGHGVVSNEWDQGSPTYMRRELDELLRDLREQLGSETASFADITLLSEVARRFDVTVQTIQKMIATDVLCGATIAGKVAVVVTSSIDALGPRVLAALSPASRLTTRDVARMVGIHEATVGYHASSGELPSIQLYPRGRRYFLIDEVEAWIDSRREQAPIASPRPPT